MRDSLIFYRSFAEGIKCLDPEDQLKALWDIIDYALDDKEPEEEGLSRAIFNMAKPQIDKNNTKYQNGCKGGRPKTQTETEMKPKQNLIETEIKPNNNLNKTKQKPNDNDNDNEYKKESIERKRFIPPTIDEVKQYCAERGNSVDAERFIDFYESKGWMVGKNKMKDWKAAVRSWEKSDHKRENKFNNFENNSYNIDELERRLVGG